MRRNDFHLLRIVLLALIICLPILFNIFFLDKLAARQLEVSLELLGRTDVTVEGLDIAPLEARISLGRLGFASRSDPMLDSWQLQDAVADLSWDSLFFRRFVLEELRGIGAIRVARESPAVYPSSQAGASSLKGEFRRFSGTNWIPDEVIPDKTVKLVKSLREEYETKYASWASSVEGHIASARNLGERVESLVTDPMPESVDGWIARVEEGRAVAMEINSAMTLLDTYKRDFDAELQDAAKTLERVKTVVERDLALIKGALGEESLNLWLQSVINELLGPRLAGAYRQAATALTVLRGLRQEEDKKSRGRMKQGRIVRFPVKPPPRFSIETLNISGESVHISGENIGVDHDLAGTPSHFLVEFDGLGGLDVLEADVTIDDRTGADNVFLGRVNFDGWDWLIDYEDESGAKNSIGGLVGASIDLSATQTTWPDLEMTGIARLTNWKGLGGGGFFPFVQEYSPPLEFQFEAQFSKESSEFKVSVLKEYIRDWVDLLSDTFLLEVRERAQDSVGADLEDFDALLVNLNEQGELLELALSQLAAQSGNLEESIAEWTEQATGGLVPSTGLLEGLRSLF